MAFEGVETSCPRLAVRGEPFLELLEGGGVEAVHPSLRLSSNGDQPNGAQHLEVLGDARLAHGQGVHEFADRMVAFEQEIEDLPAIRFGEHLQDLEFEDLRHGGIISDLYIPVKEYTYGIDRSPKYGRRCVDVRVAFALAAWADSERSPLDPGIFTGEYDERDVGDVHEQVRDGSARPSTARGAPAGR
jgi:hypothetical protein